MTTVLHFFEGTTTYYAGPHTPRGWFYTFVTRFSEGVGSRILPKQLEELQQEYDGEIETENLGTDGLLLRWQLISHGAESACKRAVDIRTSIACHLGLRTNVAIGLPRPC